MRKKNLTKKEKWLRWGILGGIVLWWLGLFTALVVNIFTLPLVRVETETRFEGGKYVVDVIAHNQAGLMIGASDVVLAYNQNQLKLIDLRPGDLLKDPQVIKNDMGEGSGEARLAVFTTEQRGRGGSLMKAVFEMEEGVQLKGKLVELVGGKCELAGDGSRNLCLNAKPWYLRFFLWGR